MKKGYLLIAALAFVLMMFQVPEAKAATLWNWDEDEVVVTQGPYTYHAYTSANDKKCWIYWIEIDPSKVHKATKLSIPSKLKGRTVTRIGYDFPEEDEDAEFYSNIFGVVVEEAHDCDGYSGLLRNLKEITIPKTVNRIEPTCFSGVDYVKTIKIPAKVKKIFGETFYGCDNLEKVVLPKKLESLVPAAFQDCPKLKKIQLSSKNKTYRVKNGVLIEKETDKAIWVLPSKKKVSIPKGVKILGDQVLAYGNARKVVIPASVQEVGAQALENEEIKKISIDPSSKYLAKDGQCIYRKSDQSLVVAMPDTKGYFRISDKVALLLDSASVAGGKVNVMVVSASVKGVGLGGFHLNRLGVMEKVYFLGTEPPKILEHVDYYAALPIFTDVYVPEEAESVYKAWYEQYDCFNYVDSWNTFKPSELKKSKKFYGEKTSAADYKYKKSNGSIKITKYVGKKKRVIVPSKIDGLKVTRIGQSAFENKKIVSVKLPATVKKIGRSAFESCKKLKNVELPNSVTEMEARAFMGCKSLEEVQIPNQIVILHGKCFKKCVKLKKITIPESVREINMQCFAGCKKLETVDMPENLESTQAGVFMNCKSLKSIVLPEGLSYLAGDLFKGCVNLEKVDVKGVITGLGSGTFCDCYQLKKLEPVRITESVYYDAFKNCRNLEATIEIMPGCYGISSGAFVNCPKIKIKNIENAAYVAKDAFNEAE